MNTSAMIASTITARNASPAKITWYVSIVYRGTSCAIILAIRVLHTGQAVSTASTLRIPRMRRQSIPHLITISTLMALVRTGATCRLLATIWTVMGTLVENLDKMSSLDRL